MLLGLFRLQAVGTREPSHGRSQQRFTIALSTSSVVLALRVSHLLKTFSFTLVGFHLSYLLILLLRNKVSWVVLLILLRTIYFSLNISSMCRGATIKTPSTNLCLA